MRDIHLDFLSNEWGHVWKKCLTYGLVALYLNCNYLVQTKCIMRKNGGGPVEKNGLHPWRSAPLAPERDATANDVTSELGI